MKTFSKQLIEHFLDADGFVRQQVERKYYDLKITFYRKSDRTEEMLKERSAKAMMYCNDDLLSEYGWADGRPTDTMYYEHGWIKGSRGFKLEDVKEH